jgi:hypothetical protein
VTKQAIVESFRDLETDDKLDLLHQLWDEISEEMEKRPATWPVCSSGSRFAGKMVAPSTGVWSPNAVRP